MYSLTGSGWIKLITITVLAAELLAACGTAQAQVPTVTVSIPTETMTPSDTPEPTATMAPTGTATPTPTETLTPTATIDVAATRTARAAATSDAVVSRIRDEMRIIGLPTNGELIWSLADDEQVDIMTTGYMESSFVPLIEDRFLKDFILRTEIYWNSESGLAGCGVIFRAAPPLENGPQYRLAFMRLSGAPAWDIEYWKNSQFVVNLMGGIKFTDSIDVKQDADNIFYLHVQGSQMTVYANGSKIGTASSDKLDEGQLAFFAFQESGQTICTFYNVSLFELSGNPD